MKITNVVSMNETTHLERLTIRRLKRLKDETIGKTGILESYKSEKLANWENAKLEIWTTENYKSRNLENWSYNYGNLKDRKVADLKSWQTGKLHI